MVVQQDNMTRSSVLTSSHGDVQIGAFEEVLSLPERYLNDHCLIRAGNLWHLFGIVGQRAGASEASNAGATSETAFAHATSPDLRTWTLHPEVMHLTGTWPEITHVFAPHVIERERRYYMLYACSDERTIQRICLATSPDLFQWERYAGNPVIVPSTYWSRWPGFGLNKPDDGSFGGCRDPHIIK